MYYMRWTYGVWAASNALVVVVPILTVLHSYHWLVAYSLLWLGFRAGLRWWWTEERHHMFLRHFCAEFYTTPELSAPPTRDRTIFAVAPHGLFSAGIGMLAGFRLRTGIHKLVAPLLLACPGFGDFLRTPGLEFDPANRAAMQRLTSAGKNIVLLPGGFTEIQHTTRFRYSLYVPTGYLAWACRTSYTVVPVLSLGENELFSTWTLTRAGHFGHRRWVIPLLVPYWDHRVPIMLCYGTPIACTPQDDVSAVRIRVQQEYVRLLRENVDVYCTRCNEVVAHERVHPSQFTITFLS